MMKQAPREWSTYRYFDPDKMLPAIHELRLGLSNKNIPKAVRNLRTNKLKGHRETWDAAIFCKLMGLHISKKIYLSNTESSDFDSIFMFEHGEDKIFSPVQLKEFVPEDLNPHAGLQNILDSCDKYVDSSELILAIKINRQESINLKDYNFKNAPVAEVWCFGAASLDQQNWYLIGDLKNKYEICNYRLPYA